MNYLDWDFAKKINDSNTDAHYLYDELQKRGIPVVIMEPLLGGRLSKLPQYLAKELKTRDPEKSVASWAFRYAGTPEGVLTVLSGMTYMEHLKDNLLSYCPLKPLTKEEQEYLQTEIARKIVGLENIPCNDCKYCMPCPYGVDIPAIFVHYNKCKNEGTLPTDSQDPNYRKYRRQFLIGQDRSVPKLRQASHCIGCRQCVSHCPQNIRIPHELHRIDEFVERLKQGVDLENFFCRNRLQATGRTSGLSPNHFGLHHRLAFRFLGAAYILAHLDVVFAVRLLAVEREPIAQV